MGLHSQFLPWYYFPTFSDEEPFGVITNPYPNFSGSLTKPSWSYLIEAEWGIYASANHTIIGWDNGLLPGQRQAITLTNAVILLIET